MDRFESYFICPAETAESVPAGLAVALAAYGLRQGHLTRRALPARPFAFLCVDGRGYDGAGRPRVTAAETVREAIVRGCRGVLLDLPDSPRSLPLARSMQAAARENGLTLCLPEPLAAATEGALALIGTALCAGSLASRLREAAARFGPERLALDVVPLRAMFRLPCPDGRGRRVDAEELQTLRQTGRAALSPELAVNSVLLDKGRRLLLYDDERSLALKLRTAAAIGIRRAFIDHAGLAALDIDPAAVELP